MFVSRRVVSVSSVSHAGVASTRRLTTHSPTHVLASRYRASSVITNIATTKLFATKLSDQCSINSRFQRGVADQSGKCSKSQPNQPPTNPAVPVATPGPAGAPATGEVRTECEAPVLPIESGQFRSPPAAPPAPHGRGAIHEPDARPVPEPCSQPRSGFK